MAEPTFLGGNEPRRTDTRWTILQKTLGAIRDLVSGGGGSGAMSSGVGSPQGVVTPTTTPAIYFDITDPNSPIQYFNVSGGVNDWIG